MGISEEDVKEAADLSADHIEHLKLENKNKILTYTELHV